MPCQCTDVGRVDRFTTVIDTGCPRVMMIGGPIAWLQSAVGSAPPSASAQLNNGRAKVAACCVATRRSRRRGQVGAEVEGGEVQRLRDTARVDHAPVRGVAYVVREARRVRP